MAIHNGIRALVRDNNHVEARRQEVVGGARPNGEEPRARVVRRGDERAVPSCRVLQRVRDEREADNVVVLEALEHPVGE